MKKIEIFYIKTSDYKTKNIIHIMALYKTCFRKKKDKKSHEEFLSKLDYLIAILDTNTNIKYRPKHKKCEDKLDEKIKKYEDIFELFDEQKRKSKL